MIRNRKLARLFSIALAVVYMLVLLLGQLLHHHNIFSQENGASNFEAQIQKPVVGSDASHCLSCHFMMEGLSDLPNHFDFKALSNQVFLEYIAFNVQHVGLVSSAVIFLRGPPHLSIL